MVRPAPEVDKPTYEIIGKVERYDQRDQPIARTILVPGTPEYEDYYSRHPELKDWDDENRRLRGASEKQKREKDPVNSQFRQAVFFPRNLLAQPSAVEGFSFSTRQEDWSTFRKVEVDPVEMTKKIKAFAQFMGADKVRITELKQDWVCTHFAHPYTPEPYGKPVELDHKYVICLAFVQDLRMVRCGTGAPIALEAGWKYAVSSLISDTLAQFIRGLGWRARALPPENSPILIVPTFIDAGMGEQGRSCHVITKEFGNNFRPGAVATDLPLIVDKPVDFGLQDFCEKCHLCADYCPSGAISHGGKEVVRGVRRWAFEGDKCRRYWDSIGSSCGICQVVCCWSHPNSLLHDTVREVAQRIPLLRKSLVRGEKIFYRFRPSPRPDWVKSKAVKEVASATTLERD